MDASFLLSVIGIFVAIIFVAVMCYRGSSAIIIAPVAAIIISLTSGLGLSEGVLTVYMGGVGGIFTSMLLTMLCAACFSHLMVKTGAAYSIADWFIKILGVKYAPIIIAFSAAVLSAGGMMVGAFMTVFPIGIYLCSKAGYSKDIVLSCVITGAWTYAYSLPFMPSLPNAMCQTYLGTSPSAGLLNGLICNILMLLLTTVFLQWNAVRWKNKGRVFEDWDDLPEMSTNNPPLYVGILPVLLVLVLYNAVSMPLPYALICGSILITLLQIKKFSAGEWFKLYQEGMQSGLGPIASTACIGGLGTLIGSTALFGAFLNWCQTTTLHPSIITFIMVTFMGSCLASSSSALSTSLPTMGPVLRELCVARGVSLGSLARVAATSAIPPSVLPHDGALVACCKMFNTTYQKSYKPLLISGFIIPFTCALLSVVLSVIGI